MPMTFPCVLIRPDRAVASTLLLAALLCLSGCRASTIGVPISGYNHTKNTYVNLFSVNNAAGANYGPGEGGAGSTCCVELPEKWVPGMRVTVRWEYSLGLKGSELFQHSTEVVVPKYSTPATINVHFYEHKKIKIIVSACGIRHQYYPIMAEDRLPWVDEDGLSSTEINARVKRQSNEC